MFRACMVFLFFGALLQAVEIKPAVVYSNEIFDKSFNESIHNGAKRFEEFSKIKVTEIEGTNATYLELLKRAAEDGYNPIILQDVYLIYKEATKLFHEFPNTNFITIDEVMEPKNLYTLVFRVHEATYLAGYLAAKLSHSKKIGFIGGTNIPVINGFLCGFMQGAKRANKEIELYFEYIGDDENVWNDAERGAKVADTLLKKGADIIFPAAGYSGVGALRVAAEAKKFGIGVDMNQNHLYPGRVLTSVLKRIDNGVFLALRIAQNNTWKNQTISLGLSEKGVGLAFDEHNQNLIPQKLKQELEQLQSEITLGRIEITDMMLTKECKVDGKTYLKNRE